MRAAVVTNNGDNSENRSSGDGGSRDDHSGSNIKMG
ncbi:uncharacterized protein G2W53_003852 [Senna tora]|uniref:Uncharacterized protein n=1 Tax=Senna tora TaxID=362788 RepID=A0A834XAV6_9FABA|nr:uncharacterized protein G2W53_003852 [Senna tora]